jgi:hypothetical protein
MRGGCAADELFRFDSVYEDAEAGDGDFDTVTGKERSDA